MTANSFSIDSLDLLEAKLNEVKTDVFSPTLAIVFTSVEYDLPAMVSTFEKHNIDLMGCSSAGEIINGDVKNNEIVVLLMDMNKDAYHISCKNNKEHSVLENAEAIGKVAIEHFDNPAILIFSGGITTDANQILTGLKSGLKKAVPIYGGLAGDDIGFEETFAFSSGWLANNGLAALIIDTDKVKVNGRIISGWENLGGIETIGGIYKITSCNDNVLHTINDLPALDVFEKYLGFAETETDSNGVNTVIGQYPLQIIKKEGHTVMRSAVIADEENRSLILAGGVNIGEDFKFGLSPGFEVLEETVKKFGSFKEQNEDIDASILVSCKARHTSFGPLITMETEGILNQWQTPSIGFFSYGEIGNVENGTCEFHNLTCSFITFKEI